MMRSFISTFALLFVCCSSIGCQKTEPTEQGAAASASASVSAAAPQADDGSHLKLWVTKSGAIEMNGKETTFDALSAELEKAAKRGGVTVLYGRDNPEAEPHPNSMKAIQQVMKNGLSLRMSTKRDYSDAVGPNGVKPQ